MIPLDLSLENLYRQYLNCRRNKRNSTQALAFEVAQERELLDLQAALRDRTYRPARSVCFYARRPKFREIFAADFRDRVVHHVLVDYLERLWEPVFIHDSYACRRGKGAHRAVARLEQFLGQATANGTRRAWYLQLDIANYFMRIDKRILYALLAPRLRDNDARWLTELLVFHDCTADFEFRGDPALAARIPAHKTLRAAPPHTGLPIGNLNSQFFANVYLNGLDQFVKHELCCRHYLRYCDDFVLLAPERETLVAWRARLAEFLRTERRLELNPRERLAPVANGIDWLGYIVRRDYKLVRRRVVHHLRERLRGFEQLLVETRADCRQFHYRDDILGALAATLASYLGHLSTARSRRLWWAVLEEFDYLERYFEISDAVAGNGARPSAGLGLQAAAERRTDGSRCVRRDRIPSAYRRAGAQYRYLRRAFPGCALFFPVGRFYEYYEPRPPGAALLGLASVGDNRRGARFGFPLHLAAN